MSNFTNSTNMGMPIPTVGVDPGPDYANNINASLGIVDQHDHSSGHGVQITPTGININADLPFGNNNLTGARSLRLQSQSAALALSTDLGCLYMVNNDLYYTDGAGNQIRVTQSGGIVGTPGSISGLVAPATASYVSANSTFVFQSAANTPANIDGASLLLRNLSLNSKALTLSAPAAMGSNYSIVMPPLPASTKILIMDSSGNMTATYGVDGTTLGISSNNLGIVAGGVNTTQLASGAVTDAKVGSGQIVRAKMTVINQTNSSSSSYSPYSPPANHYAIIMFSWTPLGATGGGLDIYATTALGTTYYSGGGGAVVYSGFAESVLLLPGDSLQVTIGGGTGAMQFTVKGIEIFTGGQ